MSDPFVRRVGEVSDIDERAVIIGVDYDTVSLTIGGMEARLTKKRAEEFAQLYVSACWQAGNHWIREAGNA